MSVEKNKVESMSSEELTAHINSIYVRSKIALFLSVVALLLSVTFFFGLSRNLKGVITHVKTIPALTEKVNTLEEQSPLPAHSQKNK